MEYGEVFICPRCDHQHLYKLATTRTDNSTAICDPCSNTEATLDYENELLPEPEHWPLEHPHL